MYDTAYRKFYLLFLEQTIQNLIVSSFLNQQKTLEIACHTKYGIAIALYLSTTVLSSFDSTFYYRENI